MMKQLPKNNISQQVPVNQGRQGLDPYRVAEQALIEAGMAFEIVPCECDFCLPEPMAA